MSLLGPEGVRQRIAELQSRLDVVRPNPPAPNPSSFKSALNGSMTPLQGNIGDGSLAPMNPHDLQIDRQASAPALRQLAAKVALHHGIDPVLFEELVNQESGFDPAARSKAGAVGLTQLMPATAAELGVSDRTDPAQSLVGGARYLRQMIEKFGDPSLALAAYNAGPGNVMKAKGVPAIPETQSYVADILARTMARKNG